MQLIVQYHSNILTIFNYVNLIQCCTYYLNPRLYVVHNLLREYFLLRRDIMKRIAATILLSFLFFSIYSVTFIHTGDEIAIDISMTNQHENGFVSKEEACKKLSAICSNANNKLNITFHNVGNKNHRKTFQKLVGSIMEGYKYNTPNKGIEICVQGVGAYYCQAYTQGANAKIAQIDEEAQKDPSSDEDSHQQNPKTLLDNYLRPSWKKMEYEKGTTYYQTPLRKKGGKCEPFILGVSNPSPDNARARNYKKKWVFTVRKTSGKNIYNSSNDGQYFNTSSAAKKAAEKYVESYAEAE